MLKEPPEIVKEDTKKKPTKNVQRTARKREKKQQKTNSEVVKRTARRQKGRKQKTS